MRKTEDRGGKRAVLFGGTTEGRLLAGYLEELGCETVVCVATEYGQELLEQDREGLHICRGRLNQEGMERLFEEVRPGMVIDATHPYAAEVTKTIKKACEARCGIRLVRCLRDSSGIGDGVICTADTEEAVSFLAQREGNILVTTGTKELAAFSRLADCRQRVYARVLPSVESVKLCRSLGYEGRHIIAMQGPFSRNMNASMLREFDCRYLVTKDGGRAGGVYEKLEAARETGAVTVLINRPDSDMGLSLEEVKMQIKEWISHEG